ncbi:hypothetical protein ABBQ32_007287 [Trebouxia sp. C0010 RCD-2024]
MEARCNLLGFLFVVVSFLLSAKVSSCTAGRASRRAQLPIRTFVVDHFDDPRGLSGFAVYQEVSPSWYAANRYRHPPPYTQLCPYDQLGSHSWPPTAVCWVGPTPLQVADAAAAVEVVDIFDYTDQQTGAKARLLARLTEGILAESITKKLAAAGSSMPGLGTSFRSLKFNHMPDWDKWELWAFNGKVLMTLAWPMWAMLTILRSRTTFPQALQLSFIGKASPLQPPLRMTGPLAAAALQLSEKAGTLLQSAGLPMQGNSFAIKAFVAISTAATIGTVILVIGLLRRTGRLEAALAMSQAHAQNLSVKSLHEFETRLSKLKAHNLAAKTRLAKAAKQQRRLSKQHASLRKAHRHAERQKTTLQQKAVQLKQLLTAMLSLGSSMQQSQNSMAAQVGQVKAELTRIERQMQALHKEAEAAEKIRADFGNQAGAAAGDTDVKKGLKQVTDHGIATNAEEAEGANAAPTALKDDDAAGSQDMSQVLPPAVSVSQVSPRIGAGRLSHDHRGDYFSESFSLRQNPFSHSFSGSITTSCGSGMDHSFVDKVCC